MLWLFENLLETGGSGWGTNIGMGFLTVGIVRLDRVSPGHILCLERLH